MGKYLSAKRLNNTIISIAIILFISLPNISAQPYSLTFRDTPLSEALIRTSNQLNIKISFDSEKLSTVIVSKVITGNTPEELIALLLDNSGFEYKYRYGRYLVVNKDNDPGDMNPVECQIIGSVSDRESGESLPYATIIVYENNYLTSASESGSFCIKNIRSNPVHIIISYIGYNQIDTAISWTNPNVNLEIGLYRKVHMLDSIIVKGNRLEMIDLRNDVDFATTIDPSRLIDLPVVAETDIFRMLQLLPGINYNENSSGLSIRGGSADQNLVLFDGQTLYNLSHYYGVVSALNPNVIKDLQVYKGGFDSRYGERVSGIVDITGKSGNQVRPRIYGDVNLLSGNITTELPFGDKLTLIAAVRRSYSDIYSTGFSDGLFERNMNSFRADSNNIVNQTSPTFYFYDYNAKLTYKTSNIESFSLSIYGGKDSYKNSYSGTSKSLIVNGSDRNSWSNYGVSGNWLKQWNESLFSNLQLGTSGYSNTSSSSTEIDRTQAPGFNEPSLPDPVNTFDTYSQNELKDIYAAIRNTYNISTVNQVNFGILLRKNTIYYHKDADQVYVYDNTNQSGWTTSAYLQDRITLFKKLTVKPGFRISYYDGTSKMYFEPRLSANLRIWEDISLRVATGRYYQFISQVLTQQETGYNKNFWVLADGSLHPEVASNHFITGLTVEKGKFLFDVETYYKSYSGLQEYIYVSQYRKNSEFRNLFPGAKKPEPGQPQPSYFVTGTGKSYGIDFLLKYKARNFTSWLSYSFARSLQRYPEINNNSIISSPADQPHQLSWTNMVTAGKWNFGTIILYSTGKPYIYFVSSDLNMPLIRYYERLPDYFRSDLSVNYNFSIKKAKFKTGVTLLNIFNTQNYFDINTRRFDFENSTFSETTLIQSQSFSINLFLHFLF